MSSSPMDSLRSLASRCVSLFRRRRLDADLDEELLAHIDLATAENINKGMLLAEARNAALRAFGGVTQTRENYCERRGFPLLQHLVRDLRFALRQLHKSPGFAFAAVLTLALGIGANTAIFSVMNAVLLRTLPVHDPRQLFYLTHENMPDKTGSTGDSRYSSGINIYNRLREDQSVVSDIIAYIPLSLTKTAVRFGDLPEEARTDEVSGNFFSALGVPMAAGLPFASADEVNHSSVAVISFSYWTARFNRDPGVVGKTIFVRGVPFTILGVAAPHFYGVESDGSATDLWIPLQTRPELPAWGIPDATGRTIYNAPNWWAMMLMVRLKPGTTAKQGASHLSPIYSHASYETAGQPNPGSPPLELQLVPARGLGTSSKDYDAPLHVLMGMVVLVLVIACVNIVMLLAARNSVREREFAVRLALGAGRGSLFRQLLAESLILVTAGVALGWLFAIEATRLLAQWSKLEISLTPDSAVLAFTLLVSALVALLLGLAPLRTATSVPVGLTLKSSSSTQSTAGRSHAYSSRVLITMQMALCCVLLFASGLLVRTLLNYRQTDLGMHADSVLAFGAHPLGSPAYSTKVAFYRLLLERLRSLPGVRSATMAELRPGTGWSDNNNLTIDGRVYPWEHGKNMLRSNSVARDFFHTLGIPILAGRDILDSDTKSASRVTVINQTLADRYFGRVDPIGHYLGDAKQRARIVGIVRDSKYTSTDEEKMPMSWYSYQQSDSISDMDIELETTANPISLLPAVQHIVKEIDPGIPLGSPQVLSSGFEETYLMPALVARLALFFGGLAALLVAIGLYGTLAYRVNRRTVEIGVRLALGAQRAQLQWMVLRDSLFLVTVGIAVGLPLAWLASRWLASMMYRLSVHDPFSYAAAVGGVTVVSIAAAVIPAHRAASVDPMRALRTE